MIEDKIIRELTDKNPTTRIQAIISLKKSGFAHAAKILVSMLSERNDNLRQSIVSTIHAIGKPAIPHLIDALKYPNQIIQTNAAKILAEIGDKSISTDILNILKSEQGPARAAIIEVLGSTKDFWSLEYLRKFLSDSDSNVRAAAARALGNLEDKLSIDHLLLLLSDRNENIRITAIEALSRFYESRVCDALWQSSLNDESADVRNSAMFALKKIGETLIRQYENSLASTNVETRAKALNNLSMIGKPVLLPILENTKHPNPAVREICAEILGNISDSIATQRLIELTNDTEQNVRLAAVTALGKIKTEITFRYLITCLKSSDSLIVNTATEALLNRSQETIIYLTDLLVDLDTNKQVLVSRLIAKIGDSSIIPAIAQNLKDARPEVREAACFALGETKTSIAANLLMDYGLQDEEASVRHTAAKSLGIIKMSIATEPLLKILKEDKKENVKIAAITALTQINDSIVAPRLEPYLSVGSKQVKISVIRALAQFNYVNALPALQKIARAWPFSDEPDEVKKAARLAIKKLLFDSQINKNP